MGRAAISEGCNGKCIHVSVEHGRTLNLYSIPIRHDGTEAQGHQGPVASLSWSQDDTQLASLGAAAAYRWDVPYRTRVHADSMVHKGTIYCSGECPASWLSAKAGDTATETDDRICCANDIHTVQVFLQTADPTRYQAPCRQPRLLRQNRNSPWPWALGLLRLLDSASKLALQRRSSTTYVYTYDAMQHLLRGGMLPHKLTIMH